MVHPINVNVLNFFGSIFSLHKNADKTCLVELHNILIPFRSDVLDQLLQVFKVPKFGVTIQQGLEFGLAGRVRLADDPDVFGKILLLRVLFFLMGKGDLIVDCREAIRGFGHASNYGIRPIE